MNNNSAILRCANCGSKNRVLLDRLSSQPRCGKCKSLLHIPDRTVSISAEQFQREVLEETIPTAVDFWAPWCGPCRMMSPILEDIAQRHPGRIKIVKVNSDENQSISARFGIQGIPTLILFRDGQELDRLVGAAPREHILHFLHL
jgi:thioredoxin 2